MFFFSILAFVLGAISFLYSPFFLLLFLPLAYFLFRRRKKKELVLSLVFLGLSLLLFFLFPKGNSGPVEGTFLVIGRKESYCLLFSFKGRYLYYDQGENNLFSLLRLKGTGEEFHFRHYEQSFDFENYLKTEGVFHQLQVEKNEILFSSKLNLSRLKEYLFRNLDEESQPLVDSLLFGNSLSSLSSHSQIESLGWTSLLALGGFHLSFLLFLLNKFLGRKGRDCYQLLSLLISLLFLIFSLFRSSMVRIFLIQLFTFFNRLFKKKISSLNLLSLVALFMLVFNPYFLISPSFYYSFPFLFILRFFPLRKMAKGKVFFFLFLTLFFLPYGLSQQYEFYILAPAVQMLLTPLSHLLFLLSLFLFVLPPVGFLLSPLCHFLFFLSEKVVALSPSLVSGRPALLFFLFFYALLLFALVFLTYRMKKLFFFATMGVLACLGLVFLPDFSNHVEIHFIDVGQGDCTLVRNGRSNFLIDTGGSLYDDLAKECLIPYFKSLKITSLDAVLITHYDFDHYGALESLKENFPVEKVLDGYDFLDQGTIDIGGVEIENLNLWAEGDSNSQSAVYSFSLEEKEILIMGDAPKEVERKIMEQYPNLSCDILRLAHHGSKTSSSREFLSFLSPEVSIISVGVDNLYDHPSPETIMTLEELNLEYHRTDEEGTIAFRFLPSLSIIGA